MGHHPMGEDVDFNPRFVAERLIDTSAVTMGALPRTCTTAFRRSRRKMPTPSPSRAATSGRRWQNGVMRETVVPMAVFT